MTTTAAALGDVSNVIGAIAWPLVVLGLAIAFKQPIADVLQRSDVEASVGPFKVAARRSEAAAAALVQASRERHIDVAPALAEREVRVASEDLGALQRTPRLLWVDDHPSNNRYEATALEGVGFAIELVTSTADALARLATSGLFDVLISDMDRPADEFAGYTLLDALRRSGNTTPVVFYTSSRAPEHVDEAVRRGAVGCTNDPTELVQLVLRGLRAAVTAESVLMRPKKRS